MSAVLPRPGDARAAWRSSGAPPEEWSALLDACGGSFFQSPAALDVALPPGRPLFARLEAEGEVLAVAAGVLCGCRLSPARRHARFAAPPATAPGVDRGAAAVLLARALAAGGAAEVEMDSFASPGALPSAGGAIPGRERSEFVLPLTADGGVRDRLGRTHRRHVAAGDRAGWTLRSVGGDEAAALLALVGEEAARRAASRGDAIAGTDAPATTGDDPAAAPWGTRVFAAFDGDTPLAVALVGWGSRRAFYLRGGSTPEGYRRAAAAWLHVAVGDRLAA
ncbi:MAG TPA: hypothetical protein VFQ39_04595, partial [Longimicrobium sp.]|nr:hypothetical protein [Longimicrobium sp.]